MFSVTARSDSVSSALVASSKMSTGRVLVERAGDRDALPLAAGEREPGLADLRLVAERQPLDELVGRGRAAAAITRGMSGSSSPKAMLRAIVSAKR